LIAGVVLAAGGASRFGSPKQLADLDGLPLLQHAIDAALAVPALDPVVVVLGAEAERVRAAITLGRAAAPKRADSSLCDEPPPHSNRTAPDPGRPAPDPGRPAPDPGRPVPDQPPRSARAVVCPDWASGMAASLRCGVEAVGECDWIVVTLGDQPRVTAQVIAATVEQALSAPAGTTAVRPTYAGVPGHPVALGRAMLPEIARLSGDVGARDLLAGATVRTFEATGLSDPADVDTPEELEALRT
jgi:CTP:molybdopterin cytidylyltransferase MocA